MSELLKCKKHQNVILGWPGAGKTTELIKRSNGNLFTPIYKEGKKVKIHNRKKYFTETYNNCKLRFRCFVESHDHIYADEPFYYLMPFDEIFLLKNKSFDITTHRTAYFMLLEPDIDIVKDHVVNSIKPDDMIKLLEKPP